MRRNRADIRRMFQGVKHRFGDVVENDPDSVLGKPRDLRVNLKVFLGVVRLRGKVDFGAFAFLQSDEGRIL